MGSTTDRAVRTVEKDVHRTDRHVPIFAGEDIPHPDPDSPFAESGTNVHLEQMKDMLLTYNEYNRDLGYVQGMSDLLAPIYAVEQGRCCCVLGIRWLHGEDGAQLLTRSVRYEAATHDPGSPSANSSTQSCMNTCRNWTRPIFSFSSECYWSGSSASLSSPIFCAFGRDCGRTITARISTSSSLWQSLRSIETSSWTT